MRLSSSAFTISISLVGLLAACLPLSAETFFVVVKGQATPVENTEALASRLKSLGASEIRHYRTLHLLRAEIPATLLPIVRRDADIAEIVNADRNTGIIDQIEQSLTGGAPSGIGISESIQHGTAGFGRLLDHIAEQHDFAIFTAGDFSSPNTIPAAGDIPGLLSETAGVTQHRHVALRALMQNAGTGNPVPAVRIFRADSVSTQPGSDFRFYKVAAGSDFQVTLAWDRHFTEDFQPYRRQLGMFLYGADGSPLAAPSTGTLVSDAASDLILKVKMTDNGSAPSGDEPFGLAISREGLQPVKEPVLDVNCSRGQSILNCTVSNTGELPVSSVIAQLHGTGYPLGKIEPGGMRTVSVPTDGDDAGQPHLTVSGQAFGEIITTAAVSASSTAPDPPQLSLSCSYTTQSASATVITCTVTAAGGVAINNTFAQASTSGGAFQKVSLGTMNGGGTAQAVFNYPGSGFVGSIISQGTADQPVTSNSLFYPVANQPPVPLHPANCTAEGSIPDAQPYPAVAGGGSVAVKTQSTCQTFVSLTPNSLVGLTVLDYGGGIGNRTVSLTLSANILPDKSTSEQTWNLLVNTGGALVPVNIPATQAGLSCTFQPTASLLNNVPVGGGLGTVTMSVGANCQWSSQTDSPGFVQFVQGPLPYMPMPPCCSTGATSVQYVVDANPGSTSRPFTLMVGGVSLSGTQLGTASPTPCTFSASASGSNLTYAGGGGGITITPNQSSCSWVVGNDSPSWLHFSNATSGMGTSTVNFSASPNITVNGNSSTRTATLTAQGFDNGKPVFTQNFYVTETGLSCTYTLNPASVSLPSTGVPQTKPTSFSVSPSNAACQWSASTTDTFMHIVSGGSTSTGNGSVSFWVDANSTTTSRDGYIEVGLVSEDAKESGQTSTTFDIGGTLTYPTTTVVDLKKVSITVTDKTTGVKIAGVIEPTTKTWSASGLKKADTFEVDITGAPPFIAAQFNYYWEPATYTKITNASPNLHAFNFNLVVQRYFTVAVIDAHGKPIPGATVTFNPIRPDAPTPQATNKEGLLNGYIREDVKYTVTVVSAGNASFKATPGDTLPANGAYQITFKSSNYSVDIQMVLTNGAALSEFAEVDLQRGVTFTYDAAPNVAPLPGPAGLTPNPPEERGNDLVLSWRQDGFVDTNAAGQKITYTASAAIAVPADLQAKVQVTLTSASKIHINNAKVTFTGKVVEKK